MLSGTGQARTIHIFHSYAQKDLKLFQQFEKHLSVWRQQGLIENWHRYAINAGDDLKSKIEEHLQKSDIILLLISPDFAASEDCFHFEMQRAMQQYEAGKASVVSILLRPTLWQEMPCAKLWKLPTSPKGLVKPVTQWRDRDEAFFRVSSALKKIIHGLAYHTPQATIEHARSRPKANLPLWSVPYQRNPYFMNRAHLLTSLHAKFNADRPEHPICQALIGPSGSGKTQLALAYAYRHRDDYQATFWIKAGSHEQLVTDFMHIAELLELPERIGEDQEAIIAAVKHWFHSHDRWLLIFDNVAASVAIKDFIPTAGKGDILITQQDPVTEEFCTKIELTKMTPDEGALFLLHRSQIIDASAPLQQATMEQIEQARTIVQLLEGHPLALAQAGACIAATKTSLADYMQIYQKYNSQLLQQQGGLTTNHPTSVTATLLLSLQKVQSTNSAALELLSFCVFLHPDEIPEELFAKGAPYLGPTLQPVMSASSQLDSAIKTLLDFSLVQHNSESNSLSLHRQVQAVLEGEMDAPKRRQWAQRAVQAVNQVFPDVELEQWSRCQQYLPHALNCAALINQWQITSPAAGRLLDEAGLYLYEHGQYTAARPLYEQALIIRQHILGLEHPDTAQILNNLGQLARKLSEYDKAEQFYEQARAIRQRVLGPEHPNTAQTLNDLGELAHTRGKYYSAETFYRQALIIRRNTLGDASSDTIRSIGDLAGIRDEQHDYVQAEALYEEARYLSEQSLGLEHPDTGLALGKLARFYRSRGKYAQSEALFKQALTITAQTLGREHPEVATLLNNQALLYRTLGNYTEAESLLQRALRIWKQVFGAEHRNTAASLNNLGLVYSDQGYYTRAEQFYLQALVIRERDPGPDHPSTAQTLANLADLYVAQHRYTQAEPLYQRALAIYQQKLEPSHPDRIAVQEKYSALQHKLNENDR